MIEKIFKMSEIEIKLRCGDIDGIKYIITDPEENIQSFWFKNDYYEEDMIKFIQKNYKGGTFVDCGACIGNHTMVFSKLADKVVSFEPIPKIHMHLVGNILINKVKNVTAYQLALGNKRGTSRMTFIGPSAGGGEMRKDGEYLTPILKLDDFHLDNIPLIKIDVQESELELLKGAKETIKKSKPDLFIECNTKRERETNLEFLQSVDKNYTVFPTVFCNSPSYLFTIKKHEVFKE